MVLQAVGIGIILLISTTFSGCGCDRRSSEPREAYPSPTEKNGNSKINQETSGGITAKTARSAFPWLESGLGADGKPLSREAQKAIRLPGEEFNRKYANGLKSMEEEDLAKALTIFEEIVQAFPGSEEASMAAYRIAQIHFRNKSNSLALQTYKKIVEEYPSSPVAENAKAAIHYLETFDQHEKAYVSPEDDDKKRRGW